MGRIDGFEESLSSPNRHLVMDFESVDVTAPFTGDKRRTMFLCVFSDIMLFAKIKQKKKLGFKQKLSLGAIACAEPKGYVGDEWPLLIMDLGGATEAILFLQTRGERDRVSANLKKLTEAAREKSVGNPEPPMSPTTAPAQAAAAEAKKQPGTLSRLVGFATGKRKRSASSGTPPDTLASSFSTPNLAREPGPTVNFAEPEPSDGGLRHSTSDLDIASKRTGSGRSKPSLQKMTPLLIVAEEEEKEGIDRWINALASSSGAATARPSTATGDNTTGHVRRKSLPNSHRGEVGAAPTTPIREPPEIPVRRASRVRSAIIDPADPEVLATFRKIEEAAAAAAAGSVPEEEPQDLVSPVSARKSRRLSRSRSDFELADQSIILPSSGSVEPEKDSPAVSSDEMRQLRRENKKLKEKLQKAEETILALSSSLRKIEKSMTATKSLWTSETADE